MLIGLSGAAGSGKNTVAELLGFRQTAFATPLYKMLAALTGLPVRDLQNRATKETPIGWLGKSPRELLQTLGTEWGRNLVAEDVWVRATLQEIAPWLAAGERVAITDVRFDNEAAAVRTAGGRVVRVVRPSHGCLASDAARHSSEAGISSHLIDAWIENTGSLDALKAAAEAVILRV